MGGLPKYKKDIIYKTFVFDENKNWRHNLNFENELGRVIFTYA